MTLDSGAAVEPAPAAATNPINAHAVTADSIDSPMYETMAQELSAAAAVLIKAARKARGGDGDATRAHIVQAVALLRGLPNIGPGDPLSLSSETPVVRGGLAVWQMRKVVAFVEANLSRHVHVQELARLLDLSASHFCRAFKCAFGASPRHYVIRRRIAVAQKMMLTTSDSLRSIAVNCGMCDQQHFTRSFRRIVGETPSMWRRTRRGPLIAD
jgi:AraC family transcriptional regulator